MLQKKTVEQWLDEVDYTYLNSADYHPHPFSLKFMNFIKLVNGNNNSNKTPAVHLAMLDTIAKRESNFIVNLAHRGIAKTSLLAEYLFLYIAVFNELPRIGKLHGAMYVAGSMENGAKALRQNLEFRYRNSEFLLNYLPESKVKFTDNLIEFCNINGDQFAIKLFGASSSIRGVKFYGQRPQLAVIDDIFTDEAARSEATREVIRDTIYNGVVNALDPMHNLVIFSGTPFNKKDLLIEAVESGAWEVNVYPICEKFPCTREEFRGSWPDRFSYDFVKERYDLAMKTGKKSSFFQELMLQLTADEDKLVPEDCIQWYERKALMQRRPYYNFYITTDFATSSKKTADYSVIAIWALNSNGDWFWVDGQCKRQSMDQNVEDLFTYVSMYRPQSVGIEVTGQQGGFISWLQKEQMARNIWFTFAQQIGTNGNSLGIRPAIDKLSRFNLVVPWFRAHKMYFPIELKSKQVIQEYLAELNLATQDGIKGKDDCLDTISMLAYMKTIVPNEVTPNIEKTTYNNLWKFSEEDALDFSETLGNYIV